MAKQSVSRTALGAAICRSIEQYQPKKTRLFYDPIAEELVGGFVQVLLKLSGMRYFTMKQMNAVAEGIMAFGFAAPATLMMLSKQQYPRESNNW